MEGKEDKSLALHSRKKSFSHAFNGLTILWQEPNAKIHAIAALLVIGLGIFRNIGRQQWMALVFAIALVLITEALNTAIEKLCDYCCDNKIHPAIKVVKDVSAAAVLLAALTSIIIAILVFLK